MKAIMCRKTHTDHPQLDGRLKMSNTRVLTLFEARFFFFNKCNIKVNATNSRITGLVLHMDRGGPEQSALWCKN